MATTLDISTLDFAKLAGLLPVVVQETRSRDVLMVGFMNELALRQTLATGLVTFWSRTRQRLWTKGETSGNTFRVSSIHPDCDCDTLLILAEATGPACHRLTPTCFDEVPASTAEAIGEPLFLATLAGLTRARIGADPATSYTARLLANPAKAAQKVGEEAVEVVIEAISGNRERLREESADLLYHLLVVLAGQGLTLTEVDEVLRARHQR
jgi:phosphoribosyl-AMP cyclohydrolase / phosphoribosyl-ATP pyrophosphohydrolase